MTRVCASCLNDPPFYDAHRAPFLFDPTVQKIVHALKYGAAFWAARFCKEPLERVSGDFRGVDAILPVPLHQKRLIQRGYNQSGVLTRVWRVILDRPIFSDALKRVKNTPTQTGLTREARQENVKDSFHAVRPDGLRGKTVLLVDDVLTTGATLSAAAKTLKEAGVKKVFASTLAMVPLEMVPTAAKLDIDPNRP